MMDKLSRKLLVEAHAQCRALLQSATREELWMACHGHPMGKEYLEYLKFFESLPYASRSATRYLSFLDSQNCAEYSRPTLGIPTLPYSPDPRKQWSGSEELDPCLQAAEDAGWAGCAGYFSRGILWVRTTNRQFAYWIEGLSTRIESQRVKDQYAARLFQPTEEEFAAFFDLLRQWHEPGLIACERHLPAGVPRMEPEKPRPVFHHDWPWLANHQDAWL